jgi:hypothetical protein
LPAITSPEGRATTGCRQPNRSIDAATWLTASSLTRGLLGLRESWSISTHTTVSSVEILSGIGMRSFRLAPPCTDPHALDRAHALLSCVRLHTTAYASGSTGPLQVRGTPAHSAATCSRSQPPGCDLRRESCCAAGEPAADLARDATVAPVARLNRARRKSRPRNRTTSGQPSGNHRATIGQPSGNQEPHWRASCWGSIWSG